MSICLTSLRYSSKYHVWKNGWSYVKYYPYIFQSRWKVPCLLICNWFRGFWGALCDKFTSQNWMANWWKAVFIFENCWCGELLIYCLFLTNSTGWLKLANCVLVQPLFYFVHACKYKHSSLKRESLLCYGHLCF